MKIIVLARVAESGEREPLCETRIALSEQEACHRLYDMAYGEDTDDERLVLDDSHGLAEQLSGISEWFYVEEHELVHAMPQEVLDAMIAHKMISVGAAQSEQEQAHSDGSTSDAAK